MFASCSYIEKIFILNCLLGYSILFLFFTFSLCQLLLVVYNFLFILLLFLYRKESIYWKIYLFIYRLTYRFILCLLSTIHLFSNNGFQILLLVAFLFFLVFLYCFTLNRSYLCHLAFIPSFHFLNLNPWLIWFNCWLFVANIETDGGGCVFHGVKFCCKEWKKSPR